MPTLTQLICQVHRCPESAAHRRLRRRIQTWPQRGWLAVWGWLLPEHRAKWHELVVDLGRCRDANEVLESVRYWRRRHPLALHALGISWLVRVESARAMRVWADYHQRTAPVDEAMPPQ
jgi:hypothetical protein